MVFNDVEAVNIVLGALVGAVFSVPVAVAISLGFARRSSQELQWEAARLRMLVNVLAWHLDDQGVISAVFDANGNLTRFRIVRVSGYIAGRSEVRADVTVIHAARPWWRFWG